MFPLMLSDFAFSPSNRNVYVISDSDYKEFIKEKALEKIKSLYNRKVIYQEQLDAVDREIMNLKKQAGLLDDPNATLSRGSTDDVNKENSDETQEPER